MAWPFSRRTSSQPSNDISISDPRLLELFSIGPTNFTNVPVNEITALGQSAFWRATSLISETLASLTLRAVKDNPDGTVTRVKSWLDNPAPEDQTQFEFVETVYNYLTIHGACPLLHIYNGAGAVAGALPLHPLAVTPRWETAQGKNTGRKLFDVTFADGTHQTFNQNELTYIPYKSLDGLHGTSLLYAARNSLGTGIAGDRAAARMFGQGALIGGLATPEEDITEEEGKVIKASLDAKISGVDNAGQIALINRKIKLQPWTFSNVDAQFLESRQFSISEVARWYGIPEFLLQAEKATSWGTGIAEQQRGLARMVLAPWANRVEQRLSRLLPPGVRAEFDFHSLERGAPEQEISLLIQQVQAQIMTVEEARAQLNRPPLPDNPAPTGATTSENQ